MIYELSNGTISVKINSLGAELICAKRGEVEYIWDGDTKWWDDKAPVLFPICGRLPEKKYSYGGGSCGRQRGCCGCFARAQCIFRHFNAYPPQSRRAES